MFASLAGSLRVAAKGNNITESLAQQEIYTIYSGMNDD